MTFPSQPRQARCRGPADGQRDGLQPAWTPVRPALLKVKGGDEAAPTWAALGSKTCLVIRSPHLFFRRSVFFLSPREMRFRELGDFTEVTQPQMAEPNPGSGPR